MSMLETRLMESGSDPKDIFEPWCLQHALGLALQLLRACLLQALLGPLRQGAKPPRQQAFQHSHFALLDTLLKALLKALLHAYAFKTRDVWHLSLPATAWAEGAQLNGRPFPATASAEGAQFNVPPSLSNSMTAV